MAMVSITLGEVASGLDDDLTGARRRKPSIDWVWSIQRPN
ncbi:unnamed protein product [Spirodela intermedia]|uniref:Uncharacterized protein n=2 Tax=Spirodela intermedia TaxID=51605 RepID=A0A7I8IBP4_SPIIN|nr:unnamed protein product [Spirodela intermedia]CAA6655008.1 unnamed protein product [Spirodela intermedia]CAA7389724.1 unnamed protein product [Spirodela intermedia]